MTFDVPLDTRPPRQSRLTPGMRHKVFGYLGTLMTLMALCDPNSGLMDIPVSFLLKNTIQLDALEVSQFRLVVSIPLYFSFLFGLVRDNWDPFKLGDRGFLLTFAFLSSATYAAFAFIPSSTYSLLLALLLLTAWSLFIASAQNGLAATIGQQHAMTGQISTVWNIFTAVPGLLAFLIGGQVSELVHRLDAQSATRSLFLVGAAASLVLAAFAIYRPSAVFEIVTREHENNAGPWADLRRLWSYKPARRALLIWMLWNFAPGTATPLQFYLQDKLGGSATQWGEWNALFTASFIPTFLLFGFLCSRVSPLRLIRWGTVVAIPQFIPLYLMNSISSALLIAIPIGLMGGLATAAYVALIMRAAPIGLQGTMMMSASSVYFIATRFGDVLGSALYSYSSDLTICIIISTSIYAIILLVLPIWPQEALDSEAYLREVD